MDMRTSIRGSTAVIHLQGCFGYTAKATFQREIATIMADASIRDIEVDLTDVDDMDSSALGALLLLRDEARGYGRTVAISGINGKVKKQLAIANFEKLFKLS
jgi:anti-anti-sigma factor